MEAKRWTIQVHITEDGDTTSARAVLSTRDTPRLAGIGQAHRNPIDRPVPEIGDELAVARALTDLAAQLHALTRRTTSSSSPVPLNGVRTHEGGHRIRLTRRALAGAPAHVRRGGVRPGS